ncbi:ADP-ribosylation factor domain-containing protein, putative [Eimeria tenella]|uniref:ADP-ribosylation factor domain-containing protein, putative n=1 Tax=Eimeria tenella TaxID=5802 RepID=U6KLB4_EIMTE|nr:ADP-ribosylation factor domain-containing protein, putative [Eimeria tenella]CDJ37606.1 ADP-ribosylation factor domain-containing protein, putative [Eimeria tenella]|eukprot:XP_013228444.1 ADP-ribosylation factor domain-containing protein, putative [Eimeria tenella]
MVLLKVLRKTKAREKELRILMLGLDAAGKTTFVRRLNGSEVDSVAPTLGFTIYPFSFQGFRLSVWDVGGQRTIRAFWRHYFECTDGLIWVVDSADRDRMKTCKEELHRLLKEERLAGVPVLILANKQDVPSALSPEGIKEALGLSDMSVSRHWAVIPCSAKNGTGLLEGISWLVSDIANRVFIKL